jgi:hypothetical protein
VAEWAVAMLVFLKHLALVARELLLHAIKVLRKKQLVVLLFHLVDITIILLLHQVLCMQKLVKLMVAEFIKTQVIGITYFLHREHLLLHKI